MGSNRRIGRFLPKRVPLSAGAAPPPTLVVSDEAAVERPAKRARHDSPRAEAVALVLSLTPPAADGKPIDAVPLAVPPPAISSAGTGTIVSHVASPASEAEPIDAVPLAARPQASSSVDAGALVPCTAPPPAPHEAPPMNAVPLAAVAVRYAPAPERAEPSWMRNLLVSRLNLRLDMPVHFMDEKVVVSTDLDPHQGRFRLPSDGVQRSLLPLLSPEEAVAANLSNEQAAAPRAPQSNPEGSSSGGSGEQGSSGETRQKKPKAKGKKHGVLPLIIVDQCGATRMLHLSRWESSRGTIIKGDGYLNFISQCSFKESDLVEIWAFRQRAFRLFGTTVPESHLYILIAKKEKQPE